MRKKHFVTLIIVFFVFAYAIVRYNILRGTPWVDLPLYVSNKAIALGSVIFIALSYILGPIKHLFPKTSTETLEWRKEFGLMGFGLAALHILISLLILDSSYYAKFFEESGKLNMTGSLSMMFGIISLCLFTLVSLTSLQAFKPGITEESWLKIQKLGYYGLLVILLHLTTMGFQGWLEPNKWPGGLLPISLIGALIILLTIAIRTLSKVKTK